MKHLKRIFVIGILAYLGTALLMFSLQRMLLFPATKEIYRNPSAMQWQFDDITLDVGQEKTHGWYIPLENARGVALFSHGNAGNIADRLESIGLLRSMGLSVLAYDYGGYGNSTGKPSEGRCYADIRAMWQFLIEEKGFKPKEILLFGRSLGGAVTCELATQVSAAGVVIESTFLSVPDMAQMVLPYLPARWLVRDKFLNKDKVGNISSPILIIHSPDDTLIPYSHGEKLFELASEPKQFLKIRGDHNIGFVESEKVYKEGWEKFLSKVFPQK